MTITCPRENFIKFAKDGIYYENKKGKLYLNDIGQKAVCSAEKGEEVILTVNGKPFSIMKKVGRKIVEERLKGEKNEIF